MPFSEMTKDRIGDIHHVTNVELGGSVSCTPRFDAIRPFATSALRGCWLARVTFFSLQLREAERREGNYYGAAEIWARTAAGVYHSGKEIPGKSMRLSSVLIFRESSNDTTGLLVNPVESTFRLLLF